MPDSDPASIGLATRWPLEIISHNFISIAITGHMTNHTHGLCVCVSSVSEKEISPTRNARQHVLDIEPASGSPG